MEGRLARATSCHTMADRGRDIKALPLGPKEGQFCGLQGPLPVPASTLLCPQGLVSRELLTCLPHTRLCFWRTQTAMCSLPLLSEKATGTVTTKVESLSALGYARMWVLAAKSRATLPLPAGMQDRQVDFGKG